MRNVFFPDEEVSEDDLKFVCYMIERIARHNKLHNKEVVNAMKYDGLAEKLSLANVLHADNPLAVVGDWTEQFGIQKGNFDVTAVNPDLCEQVSTALQMGKVYMRLIRDAITSDEDYAQAIIRVYNNPICEIIDDYNSSAYYEPSYFIARSYNAGSFN